MHQNAFEFFYCHCFNFLQNFKISVKYLKLSDYCLLLIREILASYRK